MCGPAGKALLSPLALTPIHTMHAQEGAMTYDELKPRIDGVTVLSLEQNEVKLESLWAGRRIVLAFLRHFG